MCYDDIFCGNYKHVAPAAERGGGEVHDPGKGVCLSVPHVVLHPNDSVCRMLWEYREWQ